MDYNKIFNLNKKEQKHFVYIFQFSTSKYLEYWCGGNAGREKYIRVASILVAYYTYQHHSDKEYLISLLKKVLNTLKEHPNFSMRQDAAQIIHEIHSQVKEYLRALNGQTTENHISESEPEQFKPIWLKYRLPLLSITDLRNLLQGIKADKCNMAKCDRCQSGSLPSYRFQLPNNDEIWLCENCKQIIRPTTVAKN